jgi:hypothetical protein
METANFRLFAENRNGKWKFDFRGRLTINGKWGMLFQQWGQCIKNMKMNNLIPVPCYMIKNILQSHFVIVLVKIVTSYVRFRETSSGCLT